MPPRPAARTEPGMLLQKQLTSIADTLSKAVEIRNSRVSKRATQPATQDKLSQDRVTRNSLVALDTPPASNTEFIGNALGMMIEAGLYLDFPANPDDGSDEAVMENQEEVMHIGGKAGPSVTPPELTARSSMAMSTVSNANQMLADIERKRYTATVTRSAPAGNASKQILEQIDYNTHMVNPASSSLDEHDPKALLAEIERNSRGSAITLTTARVNENELDTLRANIISMLDPKPVSATRYSRDVDADTSGVVQKKAKGTSSDAPQNQSFEPTLDKEIIPCVIALQLEQAKCRWEEVTALSRYLFGNGAGSFKAQEEKQAYVMRVEKNLDALIAEVLLKENAYHETEDKERRACRVIVTNVAADAGKEDVGLVFQEFNICDLEMLSERNPLNGTRTAYVDFHNKESARKASQVAASIFCLKPQIRLAVDDL